MEENANYLRVLKENSDLLAKVSELEKQNDYDEKVHESKLANYEQVHNQLQTKVSEQEKEIEDLKKYPGPEWISFDDHRDKIHEQSKELTSLRSENEMLKEEVEQNNDVGKLANFLQQTIRNQRDEVEKLKSDRQELVEALREVEPVIAALGDGNYKLYEKIIALLKTNP